MRIADISEFYAPTGGVRNHLNTKGRVLRASGHDHVVVAPGKCAFDGPLEPQERSATGSARVVQLGGPTLPYDPNYQLLWRLHDVRRVLCAFEPDVVSLNSLYMAPLALETLPKRLSAVRTIFWHSDFIDTYLRSRIPKQVPDAMADALFAPLWSAVRKLANASAATFAASMGQVRKLRDHGLARVIFLPFGIDRSLFRPSARNATARRALLRGDEQARLLVGVGRLAGEKRWDTVIAAAQALNCSQPVRLVVFGEGPELARLRGLADPSVVSLLGPERDRERLATALACADAFVHGGAHETYGFSVAEAMASGLPVVVPSAGAVLDLIAPGSSQTFEPGSSAACAAALARVLGPEADRFRACALDAAPLVPDSSAQILQLLRYYRELRGERQRPRVA